MIVVATLSMEKGDAGFELAADASPIIMPLPTLHTGGGYSAMRSYNLP
jgi:hypothetical protein